MAVPVEVIRRLSDEALESIIQAAMATAAEYGVGPERVVEAIMRELRTAVRNRERLTGGDGIDARLVPWRVRIQLVRGGRSEPDADTDPELPLGEPGTMVVPGLNNVGEMVASLAAQFHVTRGPHVDAPAVARDVRGLEPEVLKTKQRSIRPVLSRKGGAATWRLPYTVDGEPWQALVHLVRESML